jgi:hypothetical protein
LGHAVCRNSSAQMELCLRSAVLIEIHFLHPKKEEMGMGHGEGIL